MLVVNEPFVSSACTGNKSVYSVWGQQGIPPAQSLAAVDLICPFSQDANLSGPQLNQHIAYDQTRREEGRKG